MVALAKVADREKLKPRRDPYFAHLSRGRAIGVRKMTADSTGFWVARWRDPDTERQHHKPLGPLDHLPDSERYDAAKKAADEWFEHLEQGGRTETFTVKDACDRYVKHLARKKGEKAALDVMRRFERYVLDTPRFANTDLNKLKPVSIEVWRNRLQDRATKDGGARTDSTLNRDMTAFRAALNLAHIDGLVPTTMPWRGKLTPIKGADGRRDVYLDRNQRRELIDAAAADLALFIRAMCQLPLRPGALAGLTAGHFDKRLMTLTIGKDKTGKDRKIQLPAATAAVFDAAAKDKLPSAPLFARADGKAWDKDAWKHPFRDAADAAKLPKDATMYVIRHSTITDLVHGGLDLLTVAQISGTSVSMIERHYGHLRSDVAATALERLAL